MYPAPIESNAGKLGYRFAVLALLILWLLPLIAVALTSIRSAEDLSRGNFWGWPQEVMLENYFAVLVGSRMAQFILNSILITLPAVAGAVALSAMAGFALAKHPFPGNRVLLVIFVAGNLVPFQTLMIPVRDLVIALGIYDTRWP